jgi:hypothetical protein
MGKQKLTFRQRLRKDAEAKLDAMITTMGAAGVRVVEEHDSGIDPALLMQLASQPVQGKTLRHELVTKLANEKEDELEKLYNDQAKLDLGGDDD